ncbi:hypothetical protein [Streptomyces sp. NBC_00658]|uniref:hypothetical protein n=1 Tax=Streptomyces sp. NBC_00658 TaxID=2975800 RepID=UPI0032557839
MDHKLMALGLALTYPDQAFDEAEPDAHDLTRTVVAAAAVGQDTSEPVGRLLTTHPYLNEWVHLVLEDVDMRPPHLRNAVTRGHEPLLGDADPIAERYVCPVDGFSWYRPSAARPVPSCPFGGHALQKA